MKKANYNYRRSELVKFYCKLFYKINLWSKYKVHTCKKAEILILKNSLFRSYATLHTTC